MSNLIHVKTKTYEYWKDENELMQGDLWQWWSNGNIREHSFYVDDKLQGESIVWYANGKINEHAIYVCGNLHGESKAWYENGQLCEHCFWVDDELEIDFLKEPEKYPETDEAKLLFTLRYGGKFLPDSGETA